jgi:hypothetical protein
MKPIRLLIIFTLSAFMSGCISFFQLKEQNVNAEGSSIAVISGINNEANLSLAMILTDALQKHTKFKVMPQMEIRDRYPLYPVYIRGPWKLAYSQIDADYTKTDMNRIRDIQKKAGTRFVFAVWSPIIQSQVMTQSNSSWRMQIDKMSVITQLLEFPRETTVGYGKFEILKYEGYTGQKSKKEVMEQYCEALAKEMARKLKMERPAI